jgi:flagellar basal-body rod protein FlgF
MDPLTSTAASGLRSSLESLDLLANNLANVQTSGFKTDREFYSLYTASEAAESGAYNPTQMPDIERNWTDYAQGNLRQTSNPTDLAISGTGFFTVTGPSGPLYTRNGAFRLTAAGRLVTPEGYPLLGSGGKPIQLDPSQRLDLTPQGELRQGGQVAGTVQPVSFVRASDLSKQGASYFRFDGPATSVNPASGEVLQGRLEDSNVGSAESAVRLVTVMRQFEMLQKAIGIGVEMNQKAIQEVAKSGA